jgi:hypothetical protein
MPENGISSRDLENFTQAIGGTLKRIDSLERFERWLERQPLVASVKISDYIIKTEPPRKEVIVTHQMSDGSTTTLVIVVILNPDQTFGLANIRKP